MILKSKFPPVYLYLTNSISMLRHSFSVIIICPVNCNTVCVNWRGNFAACPWCTFVWQCQFFGMSIMLIFSCKNQFDCFKHLFKNGVWLLNLNLRNSNGAIELDFYPSILCSTPLDNPTTSRAVQHILWFTRCVEAGVNRGCRAYEIRSVRNEAKV